MNRPELNYVVLNKEMNEQSLRGLLNWVSHKIKDIDVLIKDKPKIMIMTKRDLCDFFKFSI